MTLTPLQDNERSFITSTLARFNHNKAQTARFLGISRETLYRKLWKYRAIATRSKGSQ